MVGPVHGERHVVVIDRDMRRPPSAASMPSTRRRRRQKLSTTISSPGRADVASRNSVKVGLMAPPPAAI
jgi:hypothetical protein